MGYNTKKVDVGWWLDQIHEGEAYRKRQAYEDRWSTWRAYYRGEWATDRVLPVNFFFAILRSLVPRVYFRDPAVSIAPAKPGVMNAVFAQLLERVDNKLLRSMRIKRHIKRMIADAFLYGTGVGKLGYGSQYSPTPDAQSEDGTVAPYSPRGGRLEYMAGIQPNMPWFARVHPRNVVVPSECVGAYDAMWIAHKVERPIEDVKNDPRLSHTGDIKPTKRAVSHGGRRTHQIVEMVTLYEIRDRKWNRVIIISPDTNQVLYNGPDDLQTSVGFPLFPLVFNDDDESFWGVPDSVIIEPQQLEINEIRTQMMKHRRLTLIKLLYQNGAIDETEVAKMVDEEVGGGVRVNDINGVKPMQVADIPAALQTMAEIVHGDIREEVGFSRNQMGDLHQKSGDTTATEASIVQAASELRVNERQDIVADMLVDVVKALHEIIFQYWGQEQVVDIVGPGGIPVWITFTGEMLKAGAYEVKLDIDRAIPESRTVREQRAIQAYTILKDNPLVDPVKLTRYLLRELHGVEYDDMIRGLPQGAGQTQPMNPAQYAQLVSNAQAKGVQVPGQGVIQALAGGR